MSKSYQVRVIFLSLVATSCAPSVIAIPGNVVTAKSDYSRVPSRGCADDQVGSAKYAPTQRTDSIDRYSVIASPIVRLGDILNTHLNLSLSKITEGPARAYTLYAYYGARDWLFIEPGNSLTVVADGQRIVLPGKLGSRDVGHGGSISESVIYPITEQQIRDIASAAAVTMRIRGQKGSEDFQFVPDAFCTFRRFALDVLSA